MNLKTTALCAEGPTMVNRVRHRLFKQLPWVGVLALTMAALALAGQASGQAHEPPQDDKTGVQATPLVETKARESQTKQASASVGGASGNVVSDHQPGPEKAYRIGVGDILRISVWREPEVSVDNAVVRPDGKITLPLVKEVSVLGLTTSELEWVLAKALGQYIRNPDVTVIAQEIRSMKLFIVGGVSNPGSYPLLSSTTVLHALAEAGGLTDFAKKGKIVVVRSNGERIPFDYRAAIKGEGPGDLLVAPGDTIIVPQ